MKTFSLLIPTKNRPDSLRDLLETLKQTTAHPDRIEVMVTYDKDDAISADYVNSHKNKYTFKYTPLAREHSDFINEDYYNFMARQSTADYLFVSADDIRYVVKDWDVKIESKVEMFCNDKPDRIIGVGVKDNTPKPKPSLPDFPCFPLVTKEALAYWGFVLHPFIPTWGADYLFYLLYHGAERYLAINDRIYMNQVGRHTGGTRDETGKHIEDVFNALKMNPKHNIDLHKDTTVVTQSQQLRDHLRRIK